MKLCEKLKARQLFQSFHITTHFELLSKVIVKHRLSDDFHLSPLNNHDHNNNTPKLSRKFT
jgi:hypothetical protein